MSANDKLVGMRRKIPAIVLVLTVLYPTTALAHLSVLPNVIPINKLDSVTFTVFGDESSSPMVGVNVDIPETFEYSSTDLPNGWSAVYLENAVKISGGSLASSSESLNFTIQGTPRQIGSIRFPITVVHQNGDEVKWNDTAVRPAPRIQVVKDVAEADNKPAALWTYGAPAALVIAVAAGALWFKFRTR